MYIMLWIWTGILVCQDCNLDRAVIYIGWLALSLLCILGSNLKQPHLANILDPLLSALQGRVWDGKVREGSWFAYCLSYIWTIIQWQLSHGYCHETHNDSHWSIVHCAWIHFSTVYIVLLELVHCTIGASTLYLYALYRHKLFVMLVGICHQGFENIVCFL